MLLQKQEKFNAKIKSHKIYLKLIQFVLKNCLLFVVLYLCIEFFLFARTVVYTRKSLKCEFLASVQALMSIDNDDFY